MLLAGRPPGGPAANLTRVRATRHGEHLVQLTKYPGPFPINCYLVIEGDGLTLVDTQIGSPAEDIARAASDLGSEVKRVLLTHAHYDHIGGVSDVKKRFPGAEIAIGVRDARLLQGDVSPAPGEPPVNAKGGVQKVAWKPDQLLEEGDRVGSLRVIASPGHTPGHIAFFDTRDSSLIAGDAYQTKGRVAVSGELVLVFPFLVFGTWHKPTALASARALRALNPSRLGVGHGDVVESPGPAMDAAIERAERLFKE